MARHTPPSLALPRLSRALIRNLLLVLVVLDLIALAAFSVRVETRTTRLTSTPASTPAAISVAPTPAVPVPPAAGTTTGSGGVPVPALNASPVPDASNAPNAPKPHQVKAAGAPAAADSSDEQEPSSAADPVRTAPCPVHVGDTGTDGGLQSLVGFAPAFGPFSAEAFAAASAYQPALQLIGPILAKYPALAPQLDPLLNPWLTAWGQLMDHGFTVLGPLYSPYRTAVLEAETKLAAQLAPYSQQLAASPAGGCLVELQNALLHDSPGA